MDGLDNYTMLWHNNVEVALIATGMTSDMAALAGKAVMRFADDRAIMVRCGDSATWQRIEHGASRPSRDSLV